MTGLSWQVMIAAAIGLLVVEALVPGFVFAGFAVGALALAVVRLAVGEGSVALDLFVFSLGSAAGFLVLRRLFRHRGDARGQDDDVNRY